MTARTAASTGVLDSFMSAALADDYAHVQVADSANRGRRMSVMALCAVLLALAIGVVLAALLMNTLTSADLRSRTRSELADRVTAAAETVAVRQAQVNKAQSRVSELEGRLLTAADLAPGVAAATSRLAASAGATELAGAGVRLVIDDAPGADEGSVNRVLDRDLQDVVNALWREGAQGIAINGHRLVSTTAIRAAGAAIVVNYEPLERPYVVEAVGAAAAAQESSGVGRLVAHLTRDYGLVTRVSTADIALSAGEVHQPRFATSSGTATGGAQS